MSEKAEIKYSSSSMNKIMKYPSMVPLKIVVRLNPLELGIFFKETPLSTKKKIYLVEL